MESLECVLGQSSSSEPLTPYWLEFKFGCLWVCMSTRSRCLIPTLNLSGVLSTAGTLNFFYKKPRVRGSGSAFLRIPEFESQKFLRSIKIPVFSFLTFSYFEPLIFLKFYTKNTSRTIILDFWSKELSFCIKCWWNWYPTE